MDDPLMVSFSTALESPRDMLSKLQRELNRLANASADHAAVVDHGTNAAWTAWHITDWVWKAKFKQDEVARKALESEFIDLPSEGRKRFNECLARACPGLALCRGEPLGVGCWCANRGLQTDKTAAAPPPGGRFCPVSSSRRCAGHPNELLSGSGSLGAYAAPD